jgi:hypothetical protein
MGEDKQATLLDLIDQLYDNVDSLSDFHNWEKFHQAALVANFTQGEILRFRHDSAQEIFRQAIKIREACQYCGSLPTENNFSSRKYFLLTAKYLDNLIRWGIFIRATAPSWFISAGEYVGAEDYLQCVACGGLWHLTLPEKENNGSFNRIA